MVVIADDITGAAEIAGIAFSKGQEVRLLCGCPAAGEPGPVCCDAIATTTTVIATDTRSMSEAEAAAETRCLSVAFGSPEGKELLFKKTDSALRGHVVAELTALLEVTGYERAVYLPANPSKGRTIRHGVYYINNVPIHETAFSYDPEFPARTSVLEERFPDAKAKGIVMPDAESEEDIRKVIAQYNDGKTLFAGAADLFSALLSVSRDEPTGIESREVIGMGCSEQTGIGCLAMDIFNRPHPTPVGLREKNSTLILCGSTQSKPLELGIPIAQMPREVYDGEQGADYWYSHLPSSLIPQFSTLNPHPSSLIPVPEPVEGHPSSLILTIPHTHRTGKEVAVHLRTVMAEMAKRLVNALNKEGTAEGLHLIIEGGATAWATLQALGWTQFQIVHQVAPGVVQMRAQCGALVTLKPGSYPWGGLMD